MEQYCCEISEGQWITWCDLCLRGWSSVSSTQGNALITKCPPKIYLSKYCPSEMPFPPLLHLIVGRKASLRPTSCQLDGEGSSLDESESELGFFFTNEWKVKFDKISKLTFSPFGENVNLGILSKLTFHSLMKEKPLGNKVNKCLLGYSGNSKKVIS